MESFISVFLTDLVILNRSCACATMTLQPRFVRIQYTSNVLVEFSIRIYASCPLRAFAISAILSGVDGCVRYFLLNPSMNSTCFSFGSPSPAKLAKHTAVDLCKSIPTAILIHSPSVRRYTERTASEVTAQSFIFDHDIRIARAIRSMY